MFGMLKSPMVLTALQPWALLHCGRIRSNFMALVQCAAVMTRDGASPSALPALLPDPTIGSQRSVPCDARPSTSKAALALTLPRPGPAAGSSCSPPLPVVAVSVRQEDSACSRAGDGDSHSSATNTTTPTTTATSPGSRTPTLPLLLRQPSCRWPYPTALQTPASPSPSPSASPSPPAAQKVRASMLPPPRTPPPGPLLLPSVLNPAGLFTPTARPLASSRPTGPIPCPSSASFATSAAPLSDNATTTKTAYSAPTSPASPPDGATTTSPRSSGAGAINDTPSSTASSPVGGGASTASTARGASVDPREAAKFAALAASWWRTTDGPFAPLHALNPARVRFMRQSLAALMGLDVEAPEPLAGLRVLDVGCGGGILSEALARLGAEVYGIDVTTENVEVARLHARADPRVAARVRYDVISAEDLAASGAAPYDIVVASEVLEHVSRPHQLLPVLTSLLAAPAPAEGRTAGGALVVSTLNRTPASWGVAIVGAEYVTGVVPRGTHQWRKFITPEELAVMADSCGLRVWHAAGMAPLGPRLSWQLSEDLSINYIATLRRREPQPQQAVDAPQDT